MTEPLCIASQDLVVALDYGQFYLWTRRSDDCDLPLLLLGRAQDAGDGLGQGDGLLVVLSPHQNNFEMPLRVEVWNAPPQDDLDVWQEAFLVHLDVDESGIGYESPTLNGVSIAVPSGSYAALITGRGFIALGWPGTTTPGDQWRIRLWPSDAPRQPARLRRYEPLARSLPTPEQEMAGTAAIKRIHADLDAERKLSGQRTTITVERHLDAPRSELYRFFRTPMWLTKAGSAPAGGFILDGLNQHLNDEIFGDLGMITACNGKVECQYLDGDEPTHTESTWSWTRLPPEKLLPDRRDGRPGATLVPAPSTMTLRFDLTDTTEDDAQPQTSVRITHAHVPAEWANDLTQYWRWMLERAEHLRIGTT